MLETNSDISFKDYPSQTNNNIPEPFSLPFISNKPLSRGQSNPPKLPSKKQKIGLPNIKQNQAPSNSIDLEDGTNVSQKQNKNTFAREVQEKLKMVLGGMQPSKTQEEIVESFDSDGFDFQAQINKNKQLIKQHKIKKDIQENHPQKSKQKINMGKIPKPQKHRNESLYQKRAKQYKDQLTQNKYLSKRKETLKQKNLIRESSKDIKLKNQINLNRDQKDKIEPIRRSKSKANNRILSQKSSAKNLQPVNKSVNLFDGIQNYLENPKEKRPEPKEPLIGLSLLKAKRDIEDKIKAINEKLRHTEGGENSTSELKGSDIEIIPKQFMNKEWKRVQFGEHIICQDSNFDKQLDRVNSLQEKNAISLEKYLDYQKMLLEMDIHKKSQTYRKQVSSSQ